MDSREDYLDALTVYSRSPDREIPPILDQYLNGVAKNGETMFQWPLLKPLIIGKMEQVIREVRQELGTETIPARPNVENVRFDVMHTRIMDAVQRYTGAPFTIQRLCELLVDPKQHYKRSDKFMRGLEKNVLVVSTVDPFGRKVVSESSSKHLVNGMDSNGSPFLPRDPHNTPLPPVPEWVTSTVAVTTPSVNSLGQHFTGHHSQTQQTSTDDAGITSNGVPGGLVSSVYTDQGDQPLAVHAEEVVEETVVTMDANEVASVDTDAGVSLGEEDEEMVGEDTNASTSSSSSSSSEDLSTSDTSENSAPAVSTNVCSSSEKSPPSRPWASIAGEGENEIPVQTLLPTNSFSSAVLESEEKLELVTDSNASSHASSPVQTLSPSSDFPSPSQLSATAASSSPSSSTTASTTTQSELTLNDSLGFEVTTSTCITKYSTPPSAAGNLEDTCQEKEVSVTVRTSDLVTDNSDTASDDRVSSASSFQITETSAGDIKSSNSSPSPQTVSSEHKTSVCSEEATSSLSIFNSTPFNFDISTNNMIECDSVAGLEKLVGSVMSDVPLSSSPLSTSIRSPPNPSQSSECLSSSEDSEDSSEPEVKRLRLADDTSTPTFPSQLSESVSSADGHLSPSFPPQTAECVSTAADDIPNSTTEDTASDEQSSESLVQKEAESMLTGETQDEIHPELSSEDSMEQEREGISSPPSSQLTSSSDSQGFDMCGGDSKASAEVKSVVEPPAEDNIVTSQTDTEPVPQTHESMEEN